MCVTVQKHPEHEKFYKNNPNFDEEFAEGLSISEQNKIDNQNDAKPLIESHKENKMNHEMHQGVNVKAEIASPNRNIAVKTENSSLNTDMECPVKFTMRPIETNKNDKDFNVVRFVKIYDVKKREMLHAIQQKEREQRLFHSKPAPNFQAIHAAVERKRHQQAPKVTIPMTPIVLRRHAEKQVQLQKHVRHPSDLYFRFSFYLLLLHANNENYIDFNTTLIPTERRI